MVTVGRLKAAIAPCLVASLLTGCASTSILPGHGGSGAKGAHAVGQDGPTADPAKVAVVRRWASALRSGDIVGAAKTFGLPMLFSNGPTEQLEIRTLAQAEAVQATLPCGAEVVSAFRDGQYINVLFRLVARQGRGGGPNACGTGVGSTARTEFVVRDGQIVAWLRAPSRPGDPGQPTTPAAPQTVTGPAV